MGRTIKNYLFQTSGCIGKIFNVVIIVFIFFSISIIPLFFIYTHGEFFQRLLLIEKLTVTIFITEFSLRILLAKKPAHYIFSKWGLINFLSILPFFVYKFGFTSTLLAPLLLFRALRLLEFVTFPRIEEMKKQDMQKYGHFTLMKGEKLQQIVQKHPLIFLSALSLPLLLTSIGIIIVVFFEFRSLSILVGALFIMLAIVFYIKSWLDYRYDVLFITDTRIIVQARELFGTISDKVTYESISVIIPDTQGFFKMIFGFGHLTIKTPSDSTDINFPFIQNIEEVSHLISENRNRRMNEIQKIGSL